MNNRYNDDYDDFDDGDAFETFDARGEEGSMARGPIILAAIVLLFLVFGAILWVYFTGNKTKPEDAPLISAQTDTYKETPINQTGYTTEDIDKGVYAATEGNQPPPLEIEAMGGAEQPVLKPAQTATPAAKPSSAPVPAAKTVATTPKPAPQTVTPAPAVKPATPPVASSAQTIPKTTTTPTTPVKTTGVSAQLGSFPTKAGAEKALAEYRANGMSGAAVIVPADLGAKGTWYRVKATGFKTRDQALEFCAKAKAAGANCIPAN